MYDVNVVAASHPRRFRSEELIAAAADRGVAVTRRTLSHWVTQGLIAPPTRRGLGRGRGTSATWPEAHVKTYLAIRGKRGPQAKSPATLANIPVWLWLRFGEDYVPLNQARRALGTWARSKRKVSGAAALINVRGLVKQISHPEARRADRKALREELANAAVKGRVDVPTASAAARRVIDPHQTGVMATLNLATSADALIKLFDARLRGCRLITRLSDDDLRTVRLLYVSSRAEHNASKMPRLTLPPAHDAQDEISNACLNAITLIGLMDRSSKSNGNGKN